MKEAREAIVRAGSEACSLLVCCVVFVRLVCHTRHGVRPGRDFGICVQVWNASRYLLGGMHPSSRTSSRLRCTEQQASNLPPRGSSTAPTVRRAKPHTCVAHEVRTGGMVYVVFHLMAAWHVHVALSPLVPAVRAGMTAVDGLHGKCWCALCRGRYVLHGTCHAARRVQLARPAYASFSSVSAAVCARSSAMPAGSLSNVLGVSTATPKAEMVPKWEVWMRGNRQVGSRP
jgi:hypothetical protein